MTYNISKAYRLLKKIKDPKFEIDRLEYYSLSLHLGQRDFQVMVADTTTNQCLLIEDYVFDQVESNEQKLEIIRHIFDDHHLLKAGFWNSVTVSWKNKKFSLVPSELYSESVVSGYLRMNAPFEPDNDVLFSLPHQNGDLVNVFAGERMIMNFINATYQNTDVHFMHQSSALIDGTLHLTKENNNIVLYIDRFSFHIIVSNGNKLRFYNQYPIKKFEDYQRFMKLVSKELSLNLQSAHITVYGYLGKNTPHFLELKKHIGMLQLGNRPTNLKFSYVFDEISDHQYFDLFCIYLANTHHD